MIDLKDRVKDLIVANRPQAVCVELDKKRFERLAGRSPSLISILSLIQQRIAMRYGVRAGNDMLGGIEGAREVSASLFLIDKDIDEIKDKILGAFFAEFLNPVEVLRKLFAFIGISLDSLHSWRRSGDWLQTLIDDFERDPGRYRRNFGDLFPLFKKILLDEREEHIAGEMRGLAERYDDIVAVVGAGHLMGLGNLLSDLKVCLIPLKELYDG